MYSLLFSRLTHCWLYLCWESMLPSVSVKWAVVWVGSFVPEWLSVVYSFTSLTSPLWLNPGSKHPSILFYFKMGEHICEHERLSAMDLVCRNLPHNSHQSTLLLTSDSRECIYIATIIIVNNRSIQCWFLVAGSDLIKRGEFTHWAHVS